MNQFSVLVLRVGGQWFARVGTMQGQSAANPAGALEMLSLAMRNAAQDAIVDQIVKAMEEAQP